MGKEDCGREVPTSHRVRGVLGVFQERLREFNGETERALRRDCQRGLQCRWSVVAVDEAERWMVEDVGYEVVYGQMREWSSVLEKREGTCLERRQQRLLSSCASRASQARGGFQDTRLL